MASLRSMIAHRNRFSTLTDLSPEEDQVELQYESIAKNLLRSRETVLVNATSVAKDLGYARGEKVHVLGIPCPKPPFHRMWLESNDEGQMGCLVQRIDVPDGKDPVEAFARLNVGTPVDLRRRSLQDSKVEELTVADTGAFLEAFAHLSQTEKWELELDLRDLKQTRPFNLIAQDNPVTIVHGSIWLRSPVEAACIIGNTYYWLDKDGVILNCYMVSWPPEHPKATPPADFGGILIWVLHTFARLNCHNVKLVPMKAGMPSPKHMHKHRAPSSIWHEIVVEAVQERTKRDSVPSGEKQELRFHRVRGHYADYTKGAGLFGKYKIRLWVEEHARGNRELGEVVGSYTVQ